MASPKIKIYQLPANYQQATDNDVQSVIDNELLPVIPKQDSIFAPQPLTGVKPVTNQACFPVNWNAGQSSDTLITIGQQNQTLQHNSPSTVLVGPSGALAPQVYSGASLYPASGYIIQTVAGAFDHVQFLLPYPTGQMTLKYYTKASLPTTLWALPYDLPYLGPNNSVGRVLVVGSGCQNSSYEQMAERANNWVTGPTSGVIIFPTPASGMIAKSYWFLQSTSQYFAGPQDNWVADHYRMHPDIFIGTTQYPGDNGTINGTPVVMGPAPTFQDPSTYQIDYRDGYVRFPQAVNSSQNTVRGNYAYLTNVGNVTSQLLDNQGGWVYKASTDAAFPTSHNRPWVNRNDKWLPQNVYVNGNQAGQPQTVVPYDVLSVKMS